VYFLPGKERPEQVIFIVTWIVSVFLLVGVPFFARLRMGKFVEQQLSLGRQRVRSIYIAGG
jgi:hypothetical protein